ncbi:hypothetical protein [Mycobacterium spongiae]|uniref:Secreted protein n=1 Tax=Mycobacterium spongiae TaxID=886343 RepID=A0A975JZY1_9MYCO|nr:hypothetical protein [Mycobacterium spongiae]QUR68821.1 hypothetical protein F6B93_18610 [Mycobacterium spongiae]
MRFNATLLSATLLFFLGGIVATGHGATIIAPAHAAPEGRQCPPQDGYQIQIFGNISCTDAGYIAEAYDLSGEKRQDIAEFTCERSSPVVFPIIFQCNSANGEFAVSQQS